MAKLYYRYGAMNSGKTTSILQVSHNYEERDQKVALAKPSTDTKGTEKIISRLGIAKEVDLLISPNDNVQEMFQKCGKVDALIIDEAQFLQPEQVDQLLEIAVFQDVPVLAYGLRTDFQAVAFPGAQRLLELAHSIEELKTICRCGKKATFNGRLKNGELTFSGDQVAIDGEENITYESLCSKCYLTARNLR